MDKFPQAGESSSCNTSIPIPIPIPSSSSNSTCWELGMGIPPPMVMEHENYQINVVHDPYHHHQQQQHHHHHQYQYQFHHHSPFTTTTTTSSSIWPAITSLYPIPPSLSKPSSSTSPSFFQIPTTLSPTLPQPPVQIPVLLPRALDVVDDNNEDRKSDPNNQQVPEEEEEEEEEELGAMKEMMYKIASMQPVDIDPASIRKPKRRNVRISDDPQSVAARLRRERISEKIRILQRLVPGGTKLDTASMLDEAIRYVKFLKRQIRQLQNNNTITPHHHPPPVSGGSCSQQPVTQPPPSFDDVGQFQTDVRDRSSLMELGVKMEGRSSSVGMVMVNTTNTNTTTNTTTNHSLNVEPSFTFSSN